MHVGKVNKNSSPAVWEAYPLGSSATHLSGTLDLWWSRCCATSACSIAEHHDDDWAAAMPARLPPPWGQLQTWARPMFFHKIPNRPVWLLSAWWLLLDCRYCWCAHVVLEPLLGQVVHWYASLLMLLLLVGWSSWKETESRDKVGQYRRLQFPRKRWR